MENLKKSGIITGIHYSCLHNQYVYISEENQKCPESEELAKHTLSIPFHEAMTVQELNKVIKEVGKL